MNFNPNGKMAEFMARMYMRCHGYSILEKNYITGKGTTAGEIDFIAKRKHTVVFVEVKKRKTLESAAYAISELQKQRILRGASAYLSHNNDLQNYNVRFDAILVEPPFHLQHIKNAWRMEL